MIKLYNPFLHRKDNYECFGCSPDNSQGLQMEFWDDDDSIVSYWKPKKHLEGYINVLHGGIQATILDEIASWVVYTKCKVSGVTSGLEVKYKHPLLINDSDIVVRGEVHEVNRKFATIKTSITDADGTVCSVAMVKYFLFSEELSKNKYQYPGVEAFYEKPNPNGL